jgi:cold-inducible RNA-binding protein
MRPSKRVLFNGVSEVREQAGTQLQKSLFLGATETDSSQATVSSEANSIRHFFFIPNGERLYIFMSMKLYVGNLSFNTSAQDLEKMFGEVGTVESTNLIEDRETGRSRGFAFVEMSSQEEGESAISTLNAKEIDGREMIVNEAKPRENRSGDNYNGGNRGGYGGNRNKRY